MSDILEKKNKNLHILLIEDNHLNLRIMSRFLQGLDIVVEEVNNAREAIKYAVNDQYSMIFMSTLMPEMTGLEIALKIREITTKNKGIPIIAISSNRSEKITKKMIDSGISDIIAKPLQETDVRRLIDKFNLDETILNPINYLMFDVNEFESFYNDISLQKDIGLTFLEERANDLDRIGKAFQSNSVDTIYDALHYMKGSFSYLKANKLLEITQTMLDLLKDHKLNDVLPMEKLFYQHYESLFIEISKYIKDI